MDIRFSKLDVMVSSGAVVYTLAENESLSDSLVQLDNALNGAVKRAIVKQEFKGKKGEFVSLYCPAHSELELIIIAGIGNKNEVTENSIRQLGGKLCASLNANKIKQATIIADQLQNDGSLLATLAEGIKLRAYSFKAYKTTEKEKKKFTLSLEQITIASNDPSKIEALAAKCLAVCEGVFFARNLVTEPANTLYPHAYAQRIVKELQPLGVKVTVLDKKQMEKEGMGALLGVGQGSVQESRLVVMEWKGKHAKDAPIGLVGKGVTFDTGGISIKPALKMWDMKYDMGGSAAVVGALKALALTKSDKHVVGIVGLVENMPDGNAQRPGDVVTSMSGQTIEVLNTDAEGRLVLADALTYIQKYYKPKQIIDLATLTGAIVIALGTEYAGLFSNNDALCAALNKAAGAADEKIWRFPLGEAYDALLDSPIADIQNISLGREAGSITAAQFLQRFIENNTAWAHLDIAGMAWAEKDLDHCPKGATGFGVRLLTRFIEEQA